MVNLDFQPSLRVCFVGLGQSAVCYYRCLLPATAIGADYVGVDGPPPDWHYMTGIIGGESKLPDLFDYDIVLIQQPWGPKWQSTIARLQNKGVYVLADFDDYLHGVGKLDDHDFREAFPRSKLRQYEECMKAVDGLTVSTEFLARAYGHFNKNVFICPNGIDPLRYKLTTPERKTRNVGFAGATGHRNAIMPFLTATARAMAEREDVCFVSIGQPFADGFKEHFAEHRALSVPWCPIETYPAAMTMIDVGLAPAASTGFAKAKSALRYMESGALGIPLVAHPLIYGAHVRHGETGYLATDARTAQKGLELLLDDKDVRRRMGAAAQEDVLANHTMHTTSQYWLDAIESARSRRRGKKRRR